MLPVPFGGFHTRQLTAVANNAKLPIVNIADTHFVQQSLTLHYFPNGARSLRFAFSNWELLANGEHAGYYDFILRFSVLYKGVIYRGKFNAAIDVTLIGTNFANAVLDTLLDANNRPLVIQPGDIAYVINRRVATDGGAAGNYNILGTLAGTQLRADGVFASNDTTLDLTSGTGLITQGSYSPLLAAYINPTSGLITGMDVATPGAGITSAPSIVPYYGAAGAAQPGSLMPGSGLVASGLLTGGALTGVSIANGGANHSAANPPQLCVTSPQFATSLAYGPSAIIGEPLTGNGGIHAFGDSIMSGYNSVDASGDILSSYGFYEQALAKHYGFNKFAQVSTSAQLWLTGNTNQLAFLKLLASYGYAPEYMLNGFGTNDFALNNAAAATLQTANNTLNARIKTIFPKIKVIQATVLPATKTTVSAQASRFLTVAEQTPYSSRFASGGDMETYNADLRNGGGLTVCDYVLDGNIIARDPR